MHQNSLGLFKKHLLPVLPSGARVLEVGGGRGTEHYRRAADEAGKNLTWTYCDVSNAEVKDGALPMDGPYSIQCADHLFPVVLSGQVIEHVRKPWLWVPELARVCRRGGLVCLLSPISWGYHRAPVDCWRIWPEGMRSLFDEAGLEEVLLTYEALGKDTAREQRGQINPGPVLDLVSIGRKPTEATE